jgi:hypothetical protein
MSYFPPTRTNSLTHSKLHPITAECIGVLVLKKEREKYKLFTELIRNKGYFFQKKKKKQYVSNKLNASSHFESRNTIIGW